MVNLSAEDPLPRLNFLAHKEGTSQLVLQTQADAFECMLVTTLHWPSQPCSYDWGVPISCRMEEWHRNKLQRISPFESPFVLGVQPKASFQLSVYRLMVRDGTQSVVSCNALQPCPSSVHSATSTMLGAGKHKGRRKKSVTLSSACYVWRQEKGMRHSVVRLQDMATFMTGS